MKKFSFPAIAITVSILAIALLAASAAPAANAA